MKLELPDSISSPQDLNGLLLEVHEYSRWLSHNAVKEEAGAEASPQPAISDSARAVISSWHGKKSPSVKTLDKLIEALEDFRGSASKMVITLAAPPGPKIKADLVGWCRKNLSEDVLVDFDFDGNLLGGMVVRWGSHIHDWSFRRQILENRYSFPEVLRNV